MSQSASQPEDLMHLAVGFALVALIIAIPFIAMRSGVLAGRLARRPFLVQGGVVLATLAALSVFQARLLSVSYLITFANLALYFWFCRLVVQRLVDAGRSAMWAALLLLPGVNVPFVIVAAVLPTAQATAAPRPARPVGRWRDLFRERNPKFEAMAAFLEGRPFVRALVTVMAAPMLGIFLAGSLTTEVMVYDDFLFRLTPESSQNLDLFVLSWTLVAGWPLMMVLGLPLLLYMRHRALVQWRYTLGGAAIISVLAMGYLRAVFALPVGDAWLPIAVATVSTMAVAHWLYFMDVYAKRSRHGSPMARPDTKKPPHGA